MKKTPFHEWLGKKRGNAIRLAEELGVTRGAISQWREVPIARVLEVARITRIAKSKLRPDFYPPAKRDTARP